MVFEDSKYRSRTELKKYGGEKVRIYPFRLSELLGLKAVVPFPKKFYFWWLKNTAKTLWGKNILGKVSVEMREKDWRENIVFQRGVALSALISFRNGDIETAEWGFSKSCLFATVSGLALRGKEATNFKRAVFLAVKEFPGFKSVIRKAGAVWEGRKRIEEADIFRNFEYLFFLEQL